MIDTLIRVKLIGMAITFGLLLVSPCRSETYPASLSKVNKVSTLVVYSNTGAQPSGISESRLQTILELRLRTAGLRVLSRDENAKDSEFNPYVMLNVSSLETSNQAGRPTGFAYTASLSVRIFGFVALNRTLAPSELWADSTMGVASVDSSSQAIERIVNQLTDSFLNQWLKDNPNR